MNRAGTMRMRVRGCAVVLIKCSTLETELWPGRSKPFFHWWSSSLHCAVNLLAIGTSTNPASFVLQLVLQEINLKLFSKTCVRLEKQEAFATLRASYIFASSSIYLSLSPKPIWHLKLFEAGNFWVHGLGSLRGWSQGCLVFWCFHVLSTVWRTR